MKKNIKIAIPMFLIAGSLLVTSSIYNTKAFANDEAILVTPQVEPNSIFINGEKLQEGLIKEGSTLLFPVRAVFEKLGYQVAWNDGLKAVTLTKVPHYITFSTSQDAYTFSRTAAMPLGQAPIIKDGVTYVPTTLLTELIRMEGVTVQGDYLTISTGDVLVAPEAGDVVATPVENKQDVTMIEITNIDTENNIITVLDPEKGEVNLNIKDLDIKFSNGEDILRIGQNLIVEYGDVMTASLPPMNTPKSVEVVDKLYKVEVLEVSAEDGKTSRILVKSDDLGQVVLLFGKDKKIQNLDSNSELKVGQILEVTISPAMTMSLPPITNAKTISLVTEDSKEEAALSKVIITNVNEENGQVTVKDEKLGEVILNISSDLNIEYKNQKNKLEKGQELEVQYGPVMTRSLPPINNPIKVIVIK